MKIVRSWTLRRAGSGMTLEGIIENRPAKISNIIKVETQSKEIVATHADGTLYELRFVSE